MKEAENLVRLLDELQVLQANVTEAANKYDAVPGSARDVALVDAVRRREKLAGRVGFATLAWMNAGGKIGVTPSFATLATSAQSPTAQTTARTSLAPAPAKAPTQQSQTSQVRPPLQEARREAPTPAPEPTREAREAWVDRIARRAVDAEPRPALPVSASPPRKAVEFPPQWRTVVPGVAPGVAPEAEPARPTPVAASSPPSPPAPTVQPPPVPVAIQAPFSDRKLRVIDPVVWVPALQRLLDDMGPPPRDISTPEDALHEVVRLLSIVDEIDEWNIQPAHVQMPLIGYVAACSRSLQGAKNSGTASQRLDSVFNELTAFTSSARPGFVYGLSRSHYPKNGTWLADAQHWWSVLRDIAGLEEEEAPRKTAAAVKKPAVVAAVEQDGDDEDEGDSIVPTDWPFFHLTKGKRVVIVGGDPREESRKRVEDTFKFASVEWVTADVHCRSLSQRIRNGNVEFLILLRRFISHRHDEALLPACRETRIPWASVEHGYGITQIKLSIERFCQNRLVAK